MGKTKAKVISVKTDQTIELTIGGLFYQRLNKLLLDFGNTVPHEQLLIASAKIKAGHANSDDFAFNMETLIILLRDIELKFKEEGHTEETEVEYEKPENSKKKG